MKKLLTRVAQASIALSALFVLSSVILSSKPANAAAPGQIAGGNANFTIANITKGTGFANTQSADACDTLEYRVLLYNPGPSPLSTVNIEASINTVTPRTNTVPSITVYTPSGVTGSVGFQATLNFSTAQTQSYVEHSTQLLGVAGNIIKTSADGSLADSIAAGTGPIPLGSIGDSTTE